MSVLPPGNYVYGIFVIYIYIFTGVVKEASDWQTDGGSAAAKQLIIMGPSNQIFVDKLAFISLYTYKYS